MNPIAAVILTFLFFQSTGTHSAELCGLDGYEVGFLSEPDYWTVRMEQVSDCIIPLGSTRDDVENCDIRISICKELNDSCGDYSSSTTCQVVRLKNKSEPIYYDMGTYTGNAEFSPFRNITGFEATRSAKNVTSSLNCNGTVNTSLSFVCDPNSDWHSNQINVTQYLISGAPILNDHCLYAVKLNYAGACYTAPTLSPTNCEIPPYDTNTLKSEDYWYADKGEDTCWGGSKPCKIYLAFCHPIPPGIGDACYGSSVCQVENGTGLSMGSYTNFTLFKENDETDRGGGFHMIVSNGTVPQGSKCNHGLTTHVILNCDESAVWNDRDISRLVDVEVEESCSYVIEIRYAGACLPEPEFEKSSKASPVGWILISIFVFCVIVYLAVGSAYGFFVKHERGLRVLPNYEFWYNFTMLVLEGSKFFLDIVTCFKFEGKALSVAGRQPDYDKI